MTRNENLYWLIQEARENLNDVKEFGEGRVSRELSDFTRDELTLLTYEADKLGMCIVVKYRQKTGSAYFQFVDQKEISPV